jgi:hypothetical protein
MGGWRWGMFALGWIYGGERSADLEGHSSLGSRMHADAGGAELEFSFERLFFIYPVSNQRLNCGVSHTHLKKPI